MIIEDVGAPPGPGLGSDLHQVWISAQASHPPGIAADLRSPHQYSSPLIRLAAEGRRRMLNDPGQFFSLFQGPLGHQTAESSRYSGVRFVHLLPFNNATLSPRHLDQQVIRF